MNIKIANKKPIGLRICRNLFISDLLIESDAYILNSYMDVNCYLPQRMLDFISKRVLTLAQSGNYTQPIVPTWRTNADIDFNTKF